MKKLFCLAFFSSVVCAYADFSVQLDAGRLRVDASSAIPNIDNISPSNGGSLLLLIAANGDGEFDNNVAPNNYIGGNDRVMAAGGFNSSGGTGEAVTFFYVSTNNLTLPPNDRIALRWFPQITFQDYKNGVTPVAGQVFGTYNPRTSSPPNNSDNPDGGDAWLVPAGGSIRLNFFTNDSDLGGTQSPAEGYAQLVTTPSVTPSPTAAPTATPAATATPAPSPPPTLTISGAVFYCSNPVPGPVPGVLLTLGGSAAGSNLSDGAGNYAFSSLASGGSYTVTPTKAALPPGSAGINTVDVVATQRYFLSLGTLSGCRLTAADLNGDNTINTIDIVAVQRFFLGVSTGIGNAGKYQFSPANRSYSGVSADQTGQNFDTIVFGDVAAQFVE